MGNSLNEGPRLGSFLGWFWVPEFGELPLLGGSWVVISGVISPYSYPTYNSAYNSP